MITSKEWLFLEENISSGWIKTHFSKRDAQEYARSIGWKQKHVVRIKRRFEIVWIVAQLTQPKMAEGVQFDVLRCPSGQYENKDGTQYMIVVEVVKRITAEVH